MDEYLNGSNNVNNFAGRLHRRIWKTVQVRYGMGETGHQRENGRICQEANVEEPPWLGVQEMFAA